MLLHALPDDFKLNSLANSLVLSALPDDFKLNALYDTTRSTGTEFLEMFYLVDELGNNLTDESGNFLVGYYSSTVYPQTLHALPDDFGLRAE